MNLASHAILAIPNPAPNEAPTHLVFVPPKLSVSVIVTPTPNGAGMSALTPSVIPPKSEPLQAPLAQQFVTISALATAMTPTPQHLYITWHIFDEDLQCQNTVSSEYKPMET